MIASNHSELISRGNNKKYPLAGAKLNGMNSMCQWMSSFMTILTTSLVHWVWWKKSITWKMEFCAYNEASKDLLWGYWLYPICWCTDRLEKLLQTRNDADTSNEDGNNWEQFRQSAHEFAEELRTAKMKAWQDFSSTMNYSTDPSKVCLFSKQLIANQKVFLPT